MRHRVRARLLPTLVCAGCALVTPAGAVAAGGSPVHIDPASPVAKEYALPLATARGAAPESGQSGKLFGSGIRHAVTTKQTTSTPPSTPTSSPSPVTDVATTPAVTTTPAVATTAAPDVVTSTAATVQPKPHRSRHRHWHRHDRRRHRSRTVTQPAATRTTAAKPVTARVMPAAYRVLRPGSGSGLLWMAIAAAVVISLGSAGGLLLRRRR